MKRCPNCNQFFSDENIFCLNDGTSLLNVSQPGQAPAAFLAPESSPTHFVPRPTTDVSGSSSNIPGWIYAIIGAMAAIIVALGAAFFVTRTPTEKETAKTESPTQSSESVFNTEQSNTENKKSEPRTNKPNINVFSQSPRPMPSIDPNLNPSGKWTGDWTSSKAHYTAVLVLNDNGGGKFTGEILWTLQRHTNPKKTYKVGATATEYVQGTFNPTTRTIFLSGYRKNDPSDIVVLDKYNLTLAENNQNLGGTSKSNGRFNLSR